MSELLNLSIKAENDIVSIEVIRVQNGKTYAPNKMVFKFKKLGIETEEVDEFVGVLSENYTMPECVRGYMLLQILGASIS